MCLLLGACETVIRAKVETFRNSSNALPLGTVRIEPADASLDASLEFKHYRDKLAERLMQLGYDVVEADNSEYIATLAYAVSRQEKDRPSSRVVVGGHFGYYSHYPRGSIFITDFNAKEFEYVRDVSLSLSESIAPSQTEISNTNSQVAKTIIEMRATSVGHCEHLTVVYDEMLEAIFSNMSRSNGSIDTVKVKGELRCPWVFFAKYEILRDKILVISH